MLRLERLLVRRGGFALALEASAPLEGVTALFGPSGAGKSLLLAAIAGFARPRQGRIALGEHVLDDAEARVHLPPHRRGVGLAFQEARLFPHLTVAGNLDYAERRAPQHRTGPARTELIERFELGGLLARRIAGLSGGERARVALVRALLARPRLLLLDEPFAALDGRRRLPMLRDLRALALGHGLPLVLVTHQIEDVASAADRVLGLRAGALVAEGPMHATVCTESFAALLDRRDVGVAIEGGGWLRADHVLLASVAPQGLSARHVHAGVVAQIVAESGAARLVTVRTEAGVILKARVTADAAQHLGLAPGGRVWAIYKTHATLEPLT